MFLHATNADVSRAVESGKLRSDLLFRLSGMQIRLPPLRARTGDIPLLVRHFVVRYARKYSRGAMTVTSAAMKILVAHEWPGNVRELDNCMERAVVMASETLIGPEDVEFQEGNGACSAIPFQALKRQLIHDFERRYFAHLLRIHGGDVQAVARESGQHPRAVWRFIKKHALKRPSPKRRMF